MLSCARRAASFSKLQAGFIDLLDRDGFIPDADMTAFASFIVQVAAPPFGILPGDNDHEGDQVRGFGFLHDGSFDTVFRFRRGMGFSPFVGITIPEGTDPLDIPLWDQRHESNRIQP
jgi:hypothetical protein